jgi:signal transduction histidine kinase
MAKKPFKVSARTARLIGRENVSNAEGALIELIKNSYDADSPVCVLFFDIKYDAIPVTLDSQAYQQLIKEASRIPHSNTGPSLIEEYYANTENEGFRLRAGLEDLDTRRLEIFFKSKNKLIIADAGDGMTENIIDKHWMTIGTDNKLSDAFTISGRVRAGAKGIGRFALDRLGSKCKMITSPKDLNGVGYIWSVNWEDFEIEDAVIGEVSADFQKIAGLNYRLEIVKEINNANFNRVLTDQPAKFKSGTLLKVSELRDWWTRKDLEMLYKNLQILSPPTANAKFEIFLLSSREESNFGRVDNDEFNDFDYKLFAKVNKDTTIDITIKRDEFQLNKINAEIFKRSKFQEEPYTYSNFSKKEFKIETTIESLFPEEDENKLAVEAQKLGEFDFTFYFLKNRAVEKDKIRFSYKNFNANFRSEWLKKFGGIKVFRDNFRVRPYGEIDNTSFDWLLLGERQSVSPAGITKKGGGWRVSPNQVAGVVNISRLSNLDFEDKSSREGFQENSTFSLFKKLLLKIISEFEWDRHVVMREMELFLQDSKNEAAAKQGADEILENEEDKSVEALAKEESKKDKEEVTRERDTFKTAYSSLKTQLEDAEEEIRILSALATTGLVIASFAHEFNSLKNQMTRRINYLRNNLLELLNEKKLAKQIEPRKNPFIQLNKFKEVDSKLKHWLDFSLATIRKDKRRATNITLSSYLQEFETIWKDVFHTRKVNFSYSISEPVSMKVKAFMIDVDSIFNNLLINSFNAFEAKGFVGIREIIVTVNASGSSLENEKQYLNIVYEDTGPGLAAKIRNPYDILKKGFTTKLDSSGNEIGTGLGMWIVDEAVSYYGGTIEIPKKSTGFEIIIRLPINLSDKK